MPCPEKATLINSATLSYSQGRELPPWLELKCLVRRKRPLQPDNRYRRIYAIIIVYGKQPARFHFLEKKLRRRSFLWHVPYSRELLLMRNIRTIWRSFQIITEIFDRDGAESFLPDLIDGCNWCWYGMGALSISFFFKNTYLRFNLIILVTWTGKTISLQTRRFYRANLL